MDVHCLIPTHQCLLINMHLLTSIRISTIHIHSCVVNIKFMFKQTFTVQLQQTLQSKCKIHNVLIDIYVTVTSGQPMLHTECLGAQKSHGCGQSVHGKSQNFLKHNVSCKSFLVIQAHSKS